MKQYSMILTGDIILGERSADFLQGVAPMMEQADLVLAQLEVPYTDRAPEMKGLSRSPSTLEPLKGLVDALALTGNHVYDAGEVGVEDTTAWLKENGIPFTGGGRNLEEASVPVIVDMDGCKVGYISYNCVGPKAAWAGPAKSGNPYVEILTYFDMGDVANPGGPPERTVTWPEPNTFARMKREIAALREQCDILCVYLHKGIVHKPVKLADYEQTVAYAAIDAGADVVTASHSHILHGIEVYKGKTIYHGLNNFVAWAPYLRPDFKRNLGDTKLAVDAELEWAKKRQERFGFVPDPDYPTYPFHPESVNTVAAKCIVEDGKIVETRYVPMIVDKEGVTRVVTRENGGQQVFDYMKKITDGAGLNAAFEWVGDEVRIQAKEKGE
ncbi:MAG: CapA family protein [Ruminococcaceae bacterium]|nr:CapA family protein [Oscillospiraceae bacterium]